MKKVALLGMPNTGKSTLFNQISGSSAKVGNWPGITVDLYSVKTLLNGHLTELIDLPGIYDLKGYSEDEKVVHTFLANNKIDQVLFIINSTQIDRQLGLALNIIKLGIPVVIIANMMDEAKKFGITFNFDLLDSLTGCPVVPISAKYKIGLDQLNKKIHATQKKINIPKIEISAKNIIKKTVKFPATLNDKTTKKLDSIFLHPYLGLPIFLLIIYGIFQLVFTLSGPLQDSMANMLFYFEQNFLLELFAHSDPILKSFFIDGVYSGVSTVAAFVPVIVLFFFVMTIVEDSGYFSRAAFLMDKLMERIGLDGRGFVMMLMGFGCNVPALSGTKIMRSKEMRYLTMLVIPFSLCSARLQVFLFIVSAFFASHHGALVLFFMYLLSFFSIFITAIVFKNKYKNDEPLILELPPYRFPTIKQILFRGWQEVRFFLKRASKFIVFGVIAVWALTHFPSEHEVASINTYAGQIGQFFEPVFAPIGIDNILIIALFFGFIAKEILIGALAVIFGLEGQALGEHLSQLLTNGQAISFMIFTLIYTPCVASIATLKHESKDFSLALISVGWSLVLAWVMSFIFYQSYKLFI